MANEGWVMYEGRAWGLVSAHALHYAYVHKPEVIIVNGGARTTHQRSYNMDGQWPVPGSGQHYTVLSRGPAAAMTVVYNNFDICIMLTIVWEAPSSSC